MQILCDVGILVDDEGIWRDDVNNEHLSHYSARTYHTDSGLGGPGTGKSSSATINQFRSSENGFDEGVAADDDDDTPQRYVPSPVRDRLTTPAKEMVSSQLESKSTTSYHISELENSESQQVSVTSASWRTPSRSR